MMGLGQVDEESSIAASTDDPLKTKRGKTAEGEDAPPSKRLRGPPPFAAASNVSAAVLKARAGRRKEKENSTTEEGRDGEGQSAQPDDKTDLAKTSVTPPADASNAPNLIRPTSSARESTPNYSIEAIPVESTPTPSALAEISEPIIDRVASADADIPIDPSLRDELQSTSPPVPTGTPGPSSSRTYLSQTERRANHIASEQKRRNHIRLGYAELAAIQALDVNELWPPTSDLIGEVRNSTGSVTLLGRPSGKGKAAGGNNAVAKKDGQSKSTVLLRAVSLCRWLNQGNEWFEEEIARLKTGLNEGGEDREVMASLAALGP